MVRRKSPRKSTPVSPAFLTRPSAPLLMLRFHFCIYGFWCVHTLQGVPHASVFTFKKEDHTLGNLLNMRLHQNPHVTYTGYKVPHPLFRYAMLHIGRSWPFGLSLPDDWAYSFSDFILRVQTDGTLTPRAAVVHVLKDSVRDLDITSREFTKEYELRKMVGDATKINESNGNVKWSM